MIRNNCLIDFLTAELKMKQFLMVTMQIQFVVRSGKFLIVTRKRKLDKLISGKLCVVYCHWQKLTHAPTYVQFLSYRIDVDSTSSNTFIHLHISYNCKNIDNNNTYFNFVRQWAHAIYIWDWTIVLCGVGTIYGFQHHFGNFYLIHEYIDSS